MSILSRWTFAVFLLTASLVHAETRFVLISHAPDSDAWWNVIKNAIKQAGEDFNVAVDYRNPPSGDLADMARLIEQASARNYSGIITSIADYEVLKKPLAQVASKKIPFITINSGTLAQSEKLGALMHVGQPEYDAGFEAGKKAKAAGKTSFLCVNHYATNPSSFERCKGFAEAIGADAAKSTLDSGDDPTTIESKVSAYFRKNPKTDALLALGPTSAHASIRALTKMGLGGKVFFATFDNTDEVAKAIKAGTVQFAIDQQPYLQGYVPVAVLALMSQNKVDASKAVELLKTHSKYLSRLKMYALSPTIGARHIHSGPGFIDKTNLTTVESFAGQYR